MMRIRDVCVQAFYFYPVLFFLLHMDSIEKQKGDSCHSCLAAHRSGTSALFLLSTFPYTFAWLVRFSEDPAA